MLRFSTIAVVLLLVLAGMKFTVASHYCQGKRAKTIISLNGKSASCGMEHADSPANETIIYASCCEDDLNVYNISNDYTPSDIRYIHFYNSIDFFNPELISHSSFRTTLPQQNINSPPAYFLITAVDAADICVFRI